MTLRHYKDAREHSDLASRMSWFPRSHGRLSRSRPPMEILDFPTSGIKAKNPPVGIAIFW